MQRCKQKAATKFMIKLFVVKKSYKYLKSVFLCLWDRGKMQNDGGKVKFLNFQIIERPRGCATLRCVNINVLRTLSSINAAGYGMRCQTPSCGLFIDISEVFLCISYASTKLCTSVRVRVIYVYTFYSLCVYYINVPSSYN